MFDLYTVLFFWRYFEKKNKVQSSTAPVQVYNFRDINDLLHERTFFFIARVKLVTSYQGPGSGLRLVELIHPQINQDTNQT